MQEQDNQALGMLMGDHSNKHKPIAYYSIELIQLFMPIPTALRLQATAAAAKLVEASEA